MGDKLNGKVAIVTGAGSIGPGIGNGKATAVLYAREGAKVVLVDINPDAAEETKRLLDKEGGKSITVQADVTSIATNITISPATVKIINKLFFFICSSSRIFVTFVYIITSVAYFTCKTRF